MKKFLICKTCLTVFATLLLVGCSTTTYRDVINETEKRSIESGYIGKGEPKTCGVLVKVADLYKFRPYVNNPRPMDRFPLYDRTSESSYTICWINNQRGLTAAYEACQKWFNAECAVIFQRPEKTTGVYNLLPNAMPKYDNYLKQLAAQREKEKADAANKAKVLAETQRQETCDSFGFKRGTDAHTKCQFELYKLELSAKQNQELRNTLNNAAAQQNAIQQQILEEQRFESGMRLLQQSADMLNAPSPTVNCKFNNIMQTMVCR